MKKIIVSAICMVVSAILWISIVRYAYHFDLSLGWYRILGRSVECFFIALFSFIRIMVIYKI